MWNALLILEVARKGIVPRVTRRFHDLEKQSMIRSGVIDSRKKKADSSAGPRGSNFNSKWRYARVLCTRSVICVACFFNFLVARSLVPRGVRGLNSWYRGNTGPGPRTQLAISRTFFAQCLPYRLTHRFYKIKSIWISLLIYSHEIFQPKFSKIATRKLKFRYWEPMWTKTDHFGCQLVREWRKLNHWLIFSR